MNPDWEDWGPSGWSADSPVSGRRNPEWTLQHSEVYESEGWVRGAGQARDEEYDEMGDTYTGDTAGWCGNEDCNPDATEGNGYGEEWSGGYDGEEEWDEDGHEEEGQFWQDEEDPQQWYEEECQGSWGAC